MRRRRLVWTKSFARAYRKFVRRDTRLQKSIDEALQLMSIDPFSRSLHTHKLSSKLIGALACSCGYDCRIVFFFERDAKTGEELIVLADIGSHGEVY